MNQRLLQFLSAENISQAQFADTIGVARASVSHILAGRNKPGFDFIESMSSHFPDLSLEWLINGKGKMYKSMASPTVSYKAETEPVQPLVTPSAPAEPLPAPEPVIPAEKPAPAPAPKAAEPKAPDMSALLRTSSQRNISRIIVFYDDNTYQELK